VEAGKDVEIHDYLSLTRCGNPKKNQNRPIQPHDIFVGKTAHPCAQFRLGHGCDLVNHQAADRAQSVVFARLDSQPEQRSVGGVCGEGAHRDRIGFVETIVLNDYDGTWLGGIVLAARNGPDLAAFHFTSESEMASMNC